MLEESDIELPEWTLDTVKKGIASIVVRWNHQTAQRVDEMGATITKHQYNRWRISWQLPINYSVLENTYTILTRADVEAYITANAPEIISFAKAAHDLEKL